MNNEIKIKKNCVLPKAEKGEPEYIGLKIEKSKNDNSRFKFIFPVNYYTDNEYESIKEDNLKNDIKNLLKAIYKVNSSEVYKNNSAQENTCPIDAYLWIMRNYIENGYYIEKEIIYTKKNHGKIDWKKTIKNNEFLVDNNYNIIYTKFITKQSINNVSNIITLIHKYCVYTAIETFGFFYNINLKSVEFPNINMKLDAMITILRNEYTKAFLDSKKELLMNMIKMLEWLENEKVSYDMFSICDNKFQLVFENLINERFGNVSNLKEYYPYANWNIKGKKEPSSNLREDAILNRKEAIYIIDAKYYKYAYLNDNINSLPNTSSIAKQIIYGEYVNRKENKLTYNIFLIPFNGDNKEHYIEYVGYADAEWRKENKSYDKIGRAHV